MTAKGGKIGITESESLTPLHSLRRAFEPKSQGQNSLTLFETESF